MDPDLPREGALLGASTDLISIIPLVAVDDPLPTMTLLPPVPKVESPKPKTKSPPDPLFPEPTVTYTAPPLPFDDEPLPI